MRGNSPSRIIIDVTPGATDQEYGLVLHYEHLTGGWPLVFQLLLGALGQCVNQLVPGQSVGQSPVFQAMCGVFKAFLQGVTQLQGAGPRVERVLQLPPDLPAVKKLVH